MTLLAAGMNNTVSGEQSAPSQVEAQVLDWTKSLLGFPVAASGLLVGGASACASTDRSYSRRPTGDLIPRTPATAPLPPP